MNKLVRYWNQNRGKIIITIAIIAFVIIIIQIVNEILAHGSSINTSNGNIDKTQPIQSVITGMQVSEEQTKENTNVIKQFVQYCNNKQYENSYSLLTEECKEQFNNNINTFISNYCNQVFTNKRTYDIELWINTSNMYTYKVKYYEDNLLSTGASNMNKNIEDYITVIKEENGEKISINGFITKEIINKSQKLNDIEIIINDSKIYKNYETYNITIRNNSSKTILISDRQENKDICLIDSNNVKYESFIHEVPTDSLSLKSGYEKNINIRFNKIYDLYRIIEKIQFNNIILEENYVQNPNDNSLQKIEITIDI